MGGKGRGKAHPVCTPGPPGSTRSGKLGGVPCAGEGKETAWQDFSQKFHVCLERVRGAGSLAADRAMWANVLKV